MPSITADIKVGNRLLATAVEVNYADDQQTEPAGWRGTVEAKRVPVARDIFIAREFEIWLPDGKMYRGVAYGFPMNIAIVYFQGSGLSPSECLNGKA